MTSLINSLKSRIRHLDLFGHPIVFSYEQEGQQYKTLFGGAISLVIRAAVIAYVIIVFIRLATYDDTREMATYTRQEFHHVENIEYKKWHDSHMTLFIAIKKDLSDSDQLTYK